MLGSVVRIVENDYCYDKVRRLFLAVAV